MAGDAVGALDVLEIDALLFERFKQKIAVRTDRARHGGFESRARQRDRLIEALAAAEQLHAVRRQRFARADKVPDRVGAIDVHRAEYQYVHDFSPVRFDSRVFCRSEKQLFR